MRYPNLARVYQLDALAEQVRRNGGNKEEFCRQAVQHLLLRYNFVRSTAEEVVERAWTVCPPCDGSH